MKKMYEDCKDIHKNLANFLIRYRNTPHSVTGTPPAEAMFKRSLRSRLHQITPLDQQKVDSMDIEKEQAVLDSSRIRNRQFEEQQDVYVQPTAKDTWKEGVIEKRLGDSNMYEVQFGGRKVVKHADQIKKRLRPMLQRKKPTLYSPPGNLETSNSHVQLNVSPLHNSPVRGPLELENVSPARVPSVSVSQSQPPTPIQATVTRPTTSNVTTQSTRLTTTKTNNTPNTGSAPVSLRRYDRLANKPRRRWN